ncbi:transposase [Carnobacterium maltaromaticum]|uniref:transposase n=1 Tax=Carnobacterium maltaromaticum TaxID=2751 RepID=UPI0012F855CC|nr:transposase [Carnobacterium maltaromaticum]
MGKYTIIIKSWIDNWAGSRQIIYTTKLIEGFYRQLRKTRKSKGVFHSDESLIKMLYLVMMDVMKKWIMKPQKWR